MEPLENYFKDIDIQKILDVGTGKGAFIFELRRIFPNASVTGVDPDLDSVMIARSSYPDYTFFEMSAEDMLFNDNSFDLVAISKALHHLPKIKKGLKEISRVTGSDGYVIIREPVSDGLTAAQEVFKMYHHFRSAIDRINGEYHRKTFSRDDVLKMINSAGLSIQFHFEENRDLPDNIESSLIESHIEKMKLMLKKIEGDEKYDYYTSLIDKFSSRASKNGIQPVTNIIVVARKK